MNFILVDELTINYSIANRFNRIILIMIILEPFNHDEICHLIANMKLSQGKLTICCNGLDMIILDDSSHYLWPSETE